MNSLDGRRLNAKLTRGWLSDVSHADRVADAKNGSAMLRDAILRAKGYRVPVRVVPPPPVIEIITVIRPAKRGAKKRTKKGYRKPRIEHPTIEQIKAIVAAHFDISTKEIITPDKSYRIARPRQIAMFLARQITDASFPDIAFAFGGKDHTTVIHAHREIARRAREGDPKTVAALGAVHKTMGLA